MKIKKILLNLNLAISCCFLTNITLNQFNQTFAMEADYGMERSQQLDNEFFERYANDLYELIFKKPFFESEKQNGKMIKLIKQSLANLLNFKREDERLYLDSSGKKLIYSDVEELFKQITKNAIIDSLKEKFNSKESLEAFYKSVYNKPDKFEIDKFLSKVLAILDSKYAEKMDKENSSNVLFDKNFKKSGNISFNVNWNQINDWTETDEINKNKINKGQEQEKTVYENKINENEFVNKSENKINDWTETDKILKETDEMNKNDTSKDQEQEKKISDLCKKILNKHSAFLNFLGNDKNFKNSWWKDSDSKFSTIREVLENYIYLFSKLRLFRPNIAAIEDKNLLNKTFDNLNKFSAELEANLAEVKQALNDYIILLVDEFIIKKNYLFLVPSGYIGEDIYKQSIILSNDRSKKIPMYERLNSKNYLDFIKRVKFFIDHYGNRVYNNYFLNFFRTIYDKLDKVGYDGCAKDIKDMLIYFERTYCKEQVQAYFLKFPERLKTKIFSRTVITLDRNISDEDYYDSEILCELRKSRVTEENIFEFLFKMLIECQFSNECKIQMFREAFIRNSLSTTYQATIKELYDKLDRKGKANVYEKVRKIIESTLKLEDNLKQFIAYFDNFIKRHKDKIDAKYAKDEKISVENFKKLESYLKKLKDLHNVIRNFNFSNFGGISISSKTNDELAYNYISNGFESSPILNLSKVIDNFKKDFKFDDISEDFLFTLYKFKTYLALNSVYVVNYFKGEQADLYRIYRAILRHDRTELKEILKSQFKNLNYDQISIILNNIVEYVKNKLKKEFKNIKNKLKENYEEIYSDVIKDFGIDKFLVNEFFKLKYFGKAKFNSINKLLLNYERLYKAFLKKCNDSIDKLNNLDSVDVISKDGKTSKDLIKDNLATIILRTLKNKQSKINLLHENSSILKNEIIKRLEDLFKLTFVEIEKNLENHIKKIIEDLIANGYIEFDLSGISYSNGIDSPYSYFNDFKLFKEENMTESEFSEEEGDNENRNDSDDEDRTNSDDEDRNNSDDEDRNNSDNENLSEEEDENVSDEPD